MTVLVFNFRKKRIPLVCTYQTQDRNRRPQHQGRIYRISNYEMVDTSLI